MQCLQMMRRPRWIAVPLAGVGLAAFFISGIAARWGLQTANQWDVFLGVYNDPFTVTIIIPLLFWSMIADFMVLESDGWGHAVWSRIHSRLQWWISKLVALATAAFLFVGVMFLSTALVSLIFVPVQRSWSHLVTLSNWGYRGGLSVLQLPVPPPLIMLKIFGLLTVGLFALGTVVGALVFITRQTGIASVIAGMTAFFSYVIWGRSARFYVVAPTLQLLLKAHAGINPGVPEYFTVKASIFVDMLWILLAGGIGYGVLLRRDLL